MIREQLAGGYTEYLIEPFPPEMRGRVRFFKNLPYQSPDFVPTITKLRNSALQMAAKARADDGSGFPARADWETNFPGLSTPAFRTQPTPELISQGAIFQEFA